MRGKRLRLWSYKNQVLKQLGTGCSLIAATRAALTLALAGNNGMNKVELIEKVAPKVGLTKKQVEETLDALLDTIVEALKAGSEVTLTGFGQFLVRHRSARMGVNPQKPSEKMHIPAVIVAKFKTGKGLKDALKGKTQTPSVT